MTGRHEHGRSGELLGLALVVLALLGCMTRTQKRGELLGDVEGGVKVELVKVKTTGPNLSPLGGGPASKGVLSSVERLELRLATTPPARHLPTCTPTRLDVSVAPEQERFAYRCAAASPWTIVYIVPGPQDAVDVAYRHVEWREATRTTRGAEPPPFLNPAGKIGWSRVPDLDAVAAQLLLRDDKEHAVDAARLFDELERRAGLAAVEALLPKVVTMRPTITATSQTTERDAWLSRFDRVSPAAQQAALAALRAALGRREAGAGVVLRATELIARDAELGRQHAALGARLLELETARLGEAGAPPSLAASRALALLAGTTPEHAVPTACARLKRDKNDAEALAVIALAGKAQCAGESLGDFRAPGACRDVLRACLGSLPAGESCAQEALLARFRRYFAAPRATRGFLTADVARLAALRATKLLAPELERALERASYAVDSTANLDCAAAPPVAACRCAALANLSDRAGALCEASLGGDGRARHCTFRIDDSRRRLTNVRRAADPARP